MSKYHRYSETRPIHVSVEVENAVVGNGRMEMVAHAVSAIPNVLEAEARGKFT